jgi:hypothetical protein
MMNLTKEPDLKTQMILYLLIPAGTPEGKMKTAKKNTFNEN